MRIDNFERMNNREFSNEFDTLVNSYRRFRSHDNREPQPQDTLEFDEYEKSLYLTNSQEETVLSLYTGRNSSLLSFEETEELRRYLSPLIDEAELQPIESSSGKPIGIDKKGKKTAFFTLPENLWFITYEGVNISDGKCEDASSLQVVPVTQDEYHRVRKNPFRGTNSRRALRLDLPDNMVEIVSNYTVTSYYIRYLKKLKPIVLEDMPDGLSVEGVQEETPCEVHKSLHRRILERAVELAMLSKYGIASRQNRDTQRQER